MAVPEGAVIRLYPPFLLQEGAGITEITRQKGEYVV